MDKADVALICDSRSSHLGSKVGSFQSFLDCVHSNWHESLGKELDKILSMRMSNLKKHTQVHSQTVNGTIVTDHHAAMLHEDEDKNGASALSETVNKVLNDNKSNSTEVKVVDVIKTTLKPSAAPVHIIKSHNVTATPSHSNSSETVKDKAAAISVVVEKEVKTTIAPVVSINITHATSTTPRSHSLSSVLPSIHPSAHPSSHHSAHSSAHPSAHPSTHPSAHPTAHTSAHPSAHPSVRTSIHPSTSPSVHPSGHPSVHPSGHPTVHPTAHSSARPSIHPTIKANVTIKANGTTSKPAIIVNATLSTTTKPIVIVNVTSSTTPKPTTSNSTTVKVTIVKKTVTTVKPTTSKPADKTTTTFKPLETLEQVVERQEREKQELEAKMRVERERLIKELQKRQDEIDAQNAMKALQSQRHVTATANKVPESKLHQLEHERQMVG